MTNTGSTLSMPKPGGVKHSFVFQNITVATSPVGEDRIAPVLRETIKFPGTGARLPSIRILKLPTVFCLPLLPLCLGNHCLEQSEISGAGFYRKQAIVHENRGEKHCES